RPQPLLLPALPPPASDPNSRLKGRWGLVTTPIGAFAFRSILRTDVPVPPIQICRPWLDSAASTPPPPRACCLAVATVQDSNLLKTLESGRDKRRGNRPDWTSKHNDRRSH